MPTYAALIYSKDVDWTLAEHGDEMKEYAAFGEAAAAVIRGGNALYPTSTATTTSAPDRKAHWSSLATDRSMSHQSSRRRRPARSSTSRWRS